MGIRLDPRTEASAAREIDDRGLRVLDQQLADRRLDRVQAQRDEIR